MTEEAAQVTHGSPVDFRNRKIALAFPSPDYIHVGFHHSIIQMITQTAQFVPLGLTNAASSRVAKNRIELVKNARQMGATDILYIDADSTFPVHALVTLLMHDKDVVCATTTRRKGPNRDPVAVPLDFASITPGQRMVKLRQVGLPFMLIKMSVFDKLDELGLAPEKTYFAEPPRWLMRKHGWDIGGDEDLLGEDEYFCELLLRAGFDIWCDMQLSMEIGHIGSEVFYIQNAQPAAPAKLDGTI